MTGTGSASVSGMKTTLHALALLTTLAVTAWLLAGTSVSSGLYPFACTGGFVLPMLAVWLTMRAVATLPAARLGRIAFWTVAACGWIAVLLLAQGRSETRDLDERHNILLALGCAVLGAAWLAAKARTFPTWRTLGEAAAGCAVVVLAGGAFGWSYDAKTRAIAAQAEARWAEIGLPLAAFEKTFAPSQENSGSAVVRAVLHEQLSQGFYKAGTAAAEREPAIEHSPAAADLTRRACEIIGAKQPPGDDLALPELPVSALAAHAAALDDAYRRILAAEPAVWACNPADGYLISVPNFLGIRMFSQLVSADAMRYFAAGDEAGAACAIAAGLHLLESLRQNPTLVSLMTYIAVDALIASRQVRLPATDDGLTSVAREVPIMHAELLKTLQLESWAALRFTWQISDGQTVIECRANFLPKWAKCIANRRFAFRQFAIAACNNAEHAAICQSPATLALHDFGGSLHAAVSEKNPSAWEANVARCAMRITSTLLLREQTELIREARARLAAGRPVESRASVALPHLRWELTADAAKNTVATRLVNAPQWIVDNVVVGSDFWLLPLDGSVAWQFHAPARTAAAY